MLAAVSCCGFSQTLSPTIQGQRRELCLNAKYTYFQQMILKSGQGRLCSLGPSGYCKSTWVKGASSQLAVKKTRMQVHSVHTSSVETNEPIVRKDVEASAGRLGVLQVDPNLAPHADHLNYRFDQYKIKKELIEKHEGSLEDFAEGYKKFGFNREDGATVYREWVPSAREAQLVGDFNGWNGARHRMQKNEFGVWSIRIPDRDGKSAIPHGSKVKIRLTKNDGTSVDCIPAWIKWATVDYSKFAAPYDGVYWDPPEAERYVFKNSRPPQPIAPRIYEAHVGMSSVEPRVASYREFADNVLPRIKANNYNTIQLMAVKEHAYYGCFGYHVTNFFAVSSRSGTPDDLKYLIDKAHGMGIRVLMDCVHSHASTNTLDGLNGFDLEPGRGGSYFHDGARGYHSLWDSRLFNYGTWEVQRFLLSNLRWWLEEYQFDGFRFDGVTSMLYHHHGLNMGFSGHYHEYFSPATDVDASVYMMLANELVHNLVSGSTTIAEDVSGMPTLGRPVSEGGMGFDYRLAMAIPDKWIQYIKERKDEDWQMGDITYTLLNRRHTEKCIGYAESHDQSLVGDRTFAFLLMDKEMYFGMSALHPSSPVVDRGVSLHKMIHFITFVLGGEGYLNFMGNEFGHPEWIDFPRDGNNWSYERCRRRWDLCDAEHLRYKYMNHFDKLMNDVDEKFNILSSRKQYTSCANETDKMIVFEKADMVFVFNFHPYKSYESYKVGCEFPGKYRVAFDSDVAECGGFSRVDHKVDHFTSPEGIPGVPHTNFNNRPHSFMVLAPSRTCQVYYKVPELELAPGPAPEILEQVTENEVAESSEDSDTPTHAVQDTLSFTSQEESSSQ